MHPSSSQACRGTRTRRIQSKFDAFALDRLPKQTWACYCAYKRQSEEVQSKIRLFYVEMDCSFACQFRQKLAPIAERESIDVEKFVHVAWHSGVCSPHQNGMNLTPSTAHFVAPQQCRSVVAVVKLPAARSITKRHTGQPFTRSSVCPSLPRSEETNSKACDPYV